MSLTAMLLLLAVVPASALQFGAASTGNASANWLGFAGLSYARIFGGPDRGQLVRFSSASSDATTVAESVFGFEIALPPTNNSSIAAPKLFGEFSTSVRDAGVVPGADARELGLRVNLLGGEGSVSLTNRSPSFHSAPPALAGQGPAVFAFYNFTQAEPRAGFVFGLFGQSSEALSADLAAVPPQADNATATTSLSFPLISSLSASGPFWYGNYSPAARGSSAQLNLPLKVGKVPVKLSLGAQTLTEVQPFSLATQILGPAFASSAANKYNAVGGGVTLALPLLNRRATVSLDALYQTLQHGTQAPFALTPFTPSGVNGLNPTPPGAVVYYPASDSLQQYVGAASVALPVTKSLTVKGSFAEQLSGGVDLNALTQNLTQRTTAYGGGVVYNLPKSNSSINFFFNRNVYTQDNLPTYNWAENRQNLIFSVKF